MTHRLTTNYAKNYCNRKLIVKVIVENVVTCFLGGTRCTYIKHSKSPSLQYYGVTRGQLPQRAGSLGLTAVGLPPRYPQPICTDRGPKYAGTVPPLQDFHFNHCSTYPIIHKIKVRTVTGGHRFGVMKSVVSRYSNCFTFYVVVCY